MPGEKETIVEVYWWTYARVDRMFMTKVALRVTVSCTLWPTPPINLRQFVHVEFG